MGKFRYLEAPLNKDFHLIMILDLLLNSLQTKFYTCSSFFSTFYFIVISGMSLKKKNRLKSIYFYVLEVFLKNIFLF